MYNNLYTRELQNRILNINNKDAYYSKVALEEPQPFHTLPHFNSNYASTALRPSIRDEGFGDTLYANYYRQQQQQQQQQLQEDVDPPKPDETEPEAKPEMQQGGRKKRGRKSKKGGACSCEDKKKCSCVKEGSGIIGSILDAVGLGKEKKQDEKSKEDEKLGMEVKKIEDEVKKVGGSEFGDKLNIFGFGKKRGRKPKKGAGLSDAMKVEIKDVKDPKVIEELKKRENVKGAGKKGSGIISGLFDAIGLGKSKKKMQNKLDNIEGGKKNEAGTKIYKKAGGTRLGGAKIGGAKIGGNVKTATMEAPSEKVLGEGMKKQRKPNEYMNLLKKLRQEKPELKTVKQLSEYIKANNLYNKK